MTVVLYQHIYLTSTTDHFFNILVNLTIDDASLFTLTIHIFKINLTCDIRNGMGSMTSCRSSSMLPWFHVPKDFLIIMFLSYWYDLMLTAGGVGAISGVGASGAAGTSTFTAKNSLRNCMSVENQICGKGILWIDLWSGNSLNWFTEFFWKAGQPKYGYCSSCHRCTSMTF